MSKLLEGRVAIVTGAGRGIGREHALELARQGAKVVVNDYGVSLAGEGTGESPAEEVVSLIKGMGGEAVANGADVADFEQAGAIASPELEHNRRVLDGELSGIPQLRGGSPIDIEIGVDRDGRITVTATEPKSRRKLVLESYIEGVADSADASRQADIISGIRILNG